MNAATQHRPRLFFHTEHRHPSTREPRGQHHPHEDAAGAEALGAAGGRHDSDRAPCGEGAKPVTGAEGEDGLVVGGDLDRERT